LITIVGESINGETHFHEEAEDPGQKAVMHAANTQDATPGRTVHSSHQ